MAHIVDMHQLTKDPERAVAGWVGMRTPPELKLTVFELERHLDCCSEMLSLISMIAALYVQEYEDPVAISAVDEVETLTAGLSRKIWQKIMLLEHLRAQPERLGPAPTA